MAANPEDNQEPQEEIPLTPDQEDMKRDIGTFADIEVFGESEGGKLLLKGIITDIMSAIESIAAKYPTLTMQEFVSLGADIKTKLDLVRSVTRARKHKEEIQKILEESLKE